jgi:hypothetical protein
MIKKGVSQMVAKVLAERAYEQIKKDHKSKSDSVPAKVRKSDNYKKLCKLVSERNKLNDHIEKTANQLRKAFNGAEIRTYGNVPGVNYRYQSVSERELYRQIITASHVDGIEQEKLLDYVVKKYS